MRKPKTNSTKVFGRYDPESAGAYGEFERWNEGDDNSLQRERLLRNIKRAREEELTERQKEMIELHIDYGMGIREIASDLDVSPSTVSRVIAAAKRRLERCLKYSF